MHYWGNYNEKLFLVFIILELTTRIRVVVILFGSDYSAIYVKIIQRINIMGVSPMPPASQSRPSVVKIISFAMNLEISY